MRYSITHRTEYLYERSVHHSIQELRLTPQDSTNQLLERWKISALSKLSEFIDDVDKSVDIDDNYNTEFDDTRVIVYTLSFTAKTYIYGIVNKDIGGLINTVNIQYFSGLGTTTPTRVKKYTVLPNPIDANPSGDYGFTTIIEEP